MADTQHWNSNGHLHMHCPLSGSSIKTYYLNLNCNLKTSFLTYTMVTLYVECINKMLVNHADDHLYQRKLIFYRLGSTIFNKDNWQFQKKTTVEL